MSGWIDSVVRPVEGPMTHMDLHVGVVAPADDRGALIVAIMLQEATKLLSEEKYGFLVRNWDEMEVVIGGLLRQASAAWGPPPQHVFGRKVA